jgi:hypothetical protein
LLAAHLRIVDRHKVVLGHAARLLHAALRRAALLPAAMRETAVPAAAARIAARSAARVTAAWPATGGHAAARGKCVVAGAVAVTATTVTPRKCLPGGHAGRGQAHESDGAKVSHNVGTLP